MEDDAMIQLSRAFYQMAFEFFRELMQENGGLQAMGLRVVEKYREITGARTVLFFQNMTLFGGGDFQLLAVMPRNNGFPVEKAQILDTVKAVADDKDVSVLNFSMGDCTGDGISMGVPLINGHGENIGVILLHHLPHGSHEMPQVLEHLNFFTGYISPVFHNAFTHEFQEHLIVEKTRALENEIQRRKEIQKNTDQQKIVLETIINAIPNIICLKDGEGRWILANDYEIDLLQLSRIDYKGKNSKELAALNPFFQDAFLNGVSTDEKAWRSRSISREEEIIPRVDGSVMTFDVVKIPLFNPDGSRHALVVAGRDITEEKRSEKLLKQAKEEWEKTFDAIPDVITIIDRNFKILRANKAAVAFFKEKHGIETISMAGGREKDSSLVGMQCYDVFRGKHEICPECPKFLAAGEMQAHEKITVHEEMGKIFHVTSCPVFDKNSDVQLLVHVAKDITEQKRLEKELLQAHKMEAIGTLAGGIAHDFNNILSAIIGFAELAIMDLPGDSDAMSSIDEVLKASRRAADLVKQILTFSRKSDPHIAPLLPQVIVREALKMLRSSLPTTVDIKENISDSCGRIMADPTSIHQIVVNLCTNALHAMEHEKGILTVTLQQKLNPPGAEENEGVHQGPFAVLEISDTGHGIEPEIMDRIFDPYFTTKPVDKGTGLGLAVVHGIVKECRGFIRVENKPGGGTAFYVHFPVLSHASSTLPHEEIQESPAAVRRRILVVDDEPMIVRLNGVILERLGHSVTTTTVSADAMELISGDPGRFDLVITDQTMPGMTGVELARKILKIRPDMPIILCTGHSAVLSEKDALNMGIKKYLRKPVSRAVLSREVKDVLDNRG